MRAYGNLGTVLRSASAFGVTGVITLAGAFDPFDANVIRASMGGIFGLRMVRTGPNALRAWARRFDFSVVGACPLGAQRFDRHDYAPRTIVMVGEERKGLTDAQRALCDTTLAIPMTPGTDSLNLGVATSLLLYQAAIATRTFDPPTYDGS